ncbi:MAG: hypothetical protein BM556_01850 [Bacteriovorax sp. MedPE-SWde]|nr:MAG: hypothetical protein BM556_01850 [Bacteriovorax sp. MedPE-SWde]
MGKMIWLRDETKPFEERSALTPEAAKVLMLLGHEVIVESSKNRIFKDEEYSRLGCTITKSNSWITNAPAGAIIIGLKELEEKEFPLIHRHIHFAHVYKGQDGAKETLDRFIQGGGKLYDLEYLVDQNDRRIAAFGHWAGFVGAALGVQFWVDQQLNLDSNNSTLSPYKNQSELISSISTHLDRSLSKPRVLVIGANGRCGKGATSLLTQLGLDITKWGSKDTKDRGPIEEILDFDILINCALMKNKSLPFLNAQTIQKERNLTLISDVGCDPTGPCNPLPIYNQITTMDRPLLNYNIKGGPLSITAIDHLPSLLPRESSEDFCEQLMPHLIDFLDNKIENTPWEKSLEQFFRKTIELGLRHNLSVNTNLTQ